MGAVQSGIERAGPRRGWRAATTVAVVGLVVGAVACAPPPTFGVDQQNVSDTTLIDYVDGYTCGDTTWISEDAQTFVAGRTGLLNKVSLRARPISGSSAPLAVTIRTLRPDGAPGEVVLGSGSYSGAGVADIYTQAVIDIPLEHPAAVVAGQRYALVVGVAPVAGCPPVSTYGWQLGGTADRYPHGELWNRGNLYGRPDWVQVYEGNNDLVFRTWVVC